MLDKYLVAADKVTGYHRTLARVNQLANHVEGLPNSVTSHLQGAGQPSIEYGMASAAGLVAGGIIGAKHGHWLLGSISGGSIFTNIPALIKPETRSEAFWNLLQTHGGVIASLGAKENKPLGFVLGFLAIGAVRYFYAGEGK